MMTNTTQCDVMMLQFIMTAATQVHNTTSIRLPASDGAARVLHSCCSVGEYADVLAAAAVCGLADDCE
jgi:hypothetical protein